MLETGLYTGEPSIEEKWMKELIENGYMVGNNLFAPPPNNNS